MLCGVRNTGPEPEKVSLEHMAVLYTPSFVPADSDLMNKFTARQPRSHQQSLIADH